MITLPNGVEIPLPVFIAVLFGPLVIMTVVVMFVIGPVLSLGLLAMMAIIATFVWYFSRGTDWMEPLDENTDSE